MFKSIENPVTVTFYIAAALSAVVLITSVVLGAGQFGGIVLSLAFIAIGAGIAKTQPKLAAVGASVALIGQAIAFTAAFQGHPWQIDSHMLFFALLACLVALQSIPALLVATAIIAVHHLSLTLLVPTLVYPSVDFLGNLGRTVLHAVIVLIETSVLVAAVLHRKKLEGEMLRQKDALEESLQEAEHAQRASEAAQAEVAQKSADLEVSLKAAESSRTEAEVARKEAQSLQEQAEKATQRAEELLVDAQKAAEERERANKAHQESQMEVARQQEAKAEEQNEVVKILDAALKRLREGDLTARISSGIPEAYEGLRNSFNSTTESLEKMVSEVLLRSHSIESEVSEVAAAATDLAQRTERQAHTLSEATQDLTQLSEKASLVFRAVEDATESAEKANSSASSTEKIVSEASEVMSSVHAESQEISKIVQVIDDISFQTNLLALNAGVEAARAGEKGLGFSVVASEVRALAQRSSDSATDIRDVIENSGSEVKKGTEKIADSVSSLSNVLAAVAEIKDRSVVISTTAKEQTNAAQALNAKLRELDETTQQNAAMFEETSAACTTLLEATSALRSLTENFQTTATQKTKKAAA